MVRHAARIKARRDADPRSDRLRGREVRGIVEPGAETEALKAEIAAKLAALRDPEGDRPVARRIYDTARI